MDREQMQIAEGRKKAPLVFKNAVIADVFTGRLRQADVAVAGEYIVGVGSYSGEEEVDLTGKFLIPGLVDAHMHFESSLVSPRLFLERIVPCGTTTVIADPHEIVNVAGMRGLEYMTQESRGIAPRVHWMAPSCVPANALETNGADFGPSEMRRALRKDTLFGLGEVMDVPSVLACDPEMMEKLSMFQRIDGHAPGVTGKSLNAYRLAGIATDHECSTFEQALERVELGFYVQIRQGTAARNLDAIVSGIVREKLPTDRFLFCTDDKHLDDVRKNGHINFCVRRAIELGLRPVEAIRMATFNPAQAYGLKNQGAIAPGYLADLAVLSDLSLVEPEEVYIGGQRVWKKGEAYALPNHGCNPFLKRTVKLPELTREQLKLPVRPDFPVIGIIPGEIVTKKLLMDPPEQDGYFTPVNGLLKIAVVERHGRNGHVAVGIVSGIGLRGGAIGSTIAHDSHNLILVGDNDEDMLAAAKELQRCQGGYTLVSGGKPLMTLPLPIGGLFTNDRKVNVEEIAARMKEMAHDMGVEEGIDPFMTLSFLSLPVIPELRIIDAGIYDVTTGALVR